MEVIRKDFPIIMLDNDETFLNHLIGRVEAIDELCSMEITRKVFSYHFRISPSVYKYTEPILYTILEFCNKFGIHLNLSKSIKTSSTITFDIELIK